MQHVRQPTEQEKRRFRQAQQAMAAGDPETAVRLFASVRESWYDNPDIRYLEALCWGKLGRMDKVIESAEAALVAQPDHHGALCVLANARMILGEHEVALQHYRRALSIRPNDPGVLDSYGRALSMLGLRDEAITQFRKALELQKGFAPAHVSLGNAYRAAGRPAEAMAEYKKALDLDPRQFEAHLGMGHLNSGLGGLAVAERHFRETIRLFPRCVEGLLGLANIARYKGDFDTALRHIDEAARYVTEDDPPLLAIKADMLQRAGEHARAWEIIQDLERREQMTSTAISVYLRLGYRFGKSEEALASLEECVAQPAMGDMDRKTLFFEAGDLLDKLGRYDEAFEYYRRANSVVDLRCNRARQRALTDALIETFSVDGLKAMARAETGSDRPVFILGMPRSGTSLVEQILASHPEVYGAGELGELQAMSLNLGTGKLSDPGAYLEHLPGLSAARLTELASSYLDALDSRNAEARLVTDKMPHNFLRIGLILLLFPHARIIHCRRNPLDTCLSIYFQDFVWSHDYACDLSDLGFHYGEYHRLMQHWERVVDIPMMTVQYEDMIADQEAASRRLLAFCGLEWDERVLAFHDSDRKVATASYDQVRQPIYQTSRERWRNYEHHLGPLIEALPDDVRALVPGLD